MIDHSKVAIAAAAIVASKMGRVEVAICASGAEVIPKGLYEMHGLELDYSNCTLDFSDRTVDILNMTPCSIEKHNWIKNMYKTIYKNRESDELPNNSSLPMFGKDPNKVFNNGKRRKY